MRRQPAALILAITLALPASRLAAQPASPAAPDRAAILSAEAARAQAPEQLQLLISAARTSSPAIQRIAIRALGRLERPALVPELTVLLNAADPGARAEAANALAQAAGQDAAASGPARAALIDRLSHENDADARAAICESLGRLPPGAPAEAKRVEQLLVDETARVALRKGVTVGPASPAIGLRIGWGRSSRTSTPAAVGALRGLESLLRQRGKASPPSDEALAQLRQLALVAVTPARRLALLALNAVAGADEPTIEGALADDDVEVRRLAAAAGGASASQLQRAMGDRSATVRYEALRAWGRRFQAAEGCRPIVAASRDANPHVALLALDLLGNPCQAADPAAGALQEAAAQPRDAARRSPDQTSTPATPGRACPANAPGHCAAHAIAALARIAPDAARPLLPRLLDAESWVARVYAARAASSLNDIAALRRLADDRHPNVRESAIEALSRLQKHGADEVYVRALESDDGQLIITAARALEGTTARDAAVPALLSALDRLAKADSDSSRDPRLALLDRLRELGGRNSAPALAPLLRDPDPRVAERAAQVLTDWTGEPARAAAQPRPLAPVPTDDELSRLSRSVVRVTMKGGGQFEIRLLTDLAPLSCAAFARLAARGYYNGLTIHRVVPNFLVQGGSPGANEFAGASRYMRDEVGRVTQARGTVGTSTRGRDTGDAQFYVNLTDNPRLDHDYTIFGEVTRGIETVDAILEGDSIERAEVVPTGRQGR